MQLVVNSKKIKLYAIRNRYQDYDNVALLVEKNSIPLQF